MRGGEEHPADLPNDRDGAPSSEGLSESYTGVDNLEAMEAAVRYRAFLAGLIERCGPTTNAEVMDFGAGVGTYARAARDFGYRVCCVEPDAQLGARLQEEGFRWSASVDACPAESFEFVYSFNVLEHIEADGEALRSLLSASKKGATLLLYVPAFPMLFSAMDRHVGHVRRYRRRALIELVEEAGFVVDRCRFVDSLGFVAGLVYRLLGRSGTLSTGAVASYDRVFPISRALDHLVDRWVGKNLVLLGHSPVD